MCKDDDDDKCGDDDVSVIHHVLSEKPDMINNHV